MPVTIDELKRFRLPPAFFRREADIVARELIGTALVHRRRAGVIVETEAYVGPHDLACHARFGPTERTSVMFGPGGATYVYLCYGIHEMFNIVTGPAGSGEAVLVRAIAPLVGLPDDDAIGRGPGKVTQALLLDRRHTRRDLAKGALFVAAYAKKPPPIDRGSASPFGDAARSGAAVPIEIGPRIGVDYAGEWAAAPLRFWWRDHPAVSRTRRSRSR